MGKKKDTAESGGQAGLSGLSKLTLIPFFVKESVITKAGKATT